MSTAAGLHLSQLPSPTTLLANISVLAIFASLVAAGIMKGLKEVRDFRKPAAPTQSTQSQIVGATLLENSTIREWTASNKTVVVAIGELCDILDKHRDDTAELRREVADVRHDLRAMRGAKHD